MSIPPPRWPQPGEVTSSGGEGCQTLGLHQCQLCGCKLDQSFFFFFLLSFFQLLLWFCFCHYESNMNPVFTIIQPSERNVNLVSIWKIRNIYLQCYLQIPVISAMIGGLPELVVNLYSIDCSLPINICSSLSGLQPTQSLYSSPRSSQVHLRGLLEDGVGAEHWNHYHDHQPGGKRQSRSYWTFRRDENGENDLLTDDWISSHVPVVLFPPRGNVTSTGRQRTASSTATSWWRWKAPKCTPATHCGVSL